MAHNCIDWTTRPPTRKIPLIILAHGNDRVYTNVPKEFKTLEDIARKEFNLGHVDFHILSSCVNLCGGLPARITEGAWEHVSEYIGCATVEVAGARVAEGRVPQEEPPQAENVADEPSVNAKGKQPLIVDEPDQHPDGQPSTSAKGAAQEQEDAPSDHGRDHSRPATPVHQPAEPADEEVSAFIPRKSRRHRRLASEDEGEAEENESERERGTQAEEAPSVSSPQRPSKVVKKERKSDYRSEPDEQPPDEPQKPIKQEKRGARDPSQSRLQSQSDARTQAPAESSDSQKLMIRVAHRPSQQESKFTTKSTTKVSKVLAGACKSFGLDVSRATMYLIVSMEDEDGEVENLFPCDKNDTIARAGAERDTESRFLLTIAGEE